MGLRNPFAMGFDKAGRLIAIDQGTMTAECAP